MIHKFDFLTPLVIGGSIIKGLMERNENIINSLYIQDPWFTGITDGNKSIEGRVGKAEKYSHWIGKPAIFKGPSDRILRVMVTDVRHYDTLDDYLAFDDWTKIRANDSISTLTALKEAYLAIVDRNDRRVFSDESVKLAGGMNAIEFRLL